MGQSSSRPSPSRPASLAPAIGTDTSSSSVSGSNPADGASGTSSSRTRSRRLSRLPTIPRRLRRLSTPSLTTSTSTPSATSSRKDLVAVAENRSPTAASQRRWPLSIRKRRNHTREEDGAQEVDEERTRGAEVTEWAKAKEEASWDDKGKENDREEDGASTQGESSAAPAADAAAPAAAEEMMVEKDQGLEMPDRATPSADAASTHEVGEAHDPHPDADSEPALTPIPDIDEVTDYSFPSLSTSPASSDASPLELLNSTPIIPVDAATSAAPTNAPQNIAPAPVPPALERRFPPAGTLVVVQGVVHTTDVSASAPPPPTRAPQQPQAQSHPHPTPSTSSRRASSVPARRRLSSLIPRPMASRRSSFVSPDWAASEAPAQSGDPSSASAPAADGDTDRDHDGDQAGPPAPPESSGAGSGRPAPLSPSSIDVLGTLLSVATAATAASLVSGSSDPLFTSGLAASSAPNPNAPSAPASPSLPASSSPSPEPDPLAHRPLSPTPTAGLGALGGLGIPPLPPSSRDRMRNAWGSIRDRFGLNAPGAARAGAGAPAQGANMDPRSQLLAEMARAFHLGMGLDAPDANGAPAPAAPAGAAGEDAAREPLTINSWPPNLAALGSNPDPSVPLPPADSFERFLVDLQIDLRRTLAEERVAEPEPEPEHEYEGPPEETEDREEEPEEMLPWPVPVEELLAEDGAEVEAEPEPEAEVDVDVEETPVPYVAEDKVASADPEADTSITTDVVTDTNTETEAGPSLSTTVPLRSRSRTSSMPSLETVSDSSSERSDDDDDEEYHSDSASSMFDSDAEQDQDQAEHAVPSPEPFSMHLPPRATSGSQRRPGGGINWWRMYRFPPMVAPQGHGAPGASAGAGSSPFAPRVQPGGAGGAETEGVAGTEGSASPNPGSGPGPAETAAAQGDNIIVPVIVVGLQSVTGHGHRHLHPHHPHPQPHLHPPTAEDGQEAGSAEEGEGATGAARPGTPRGRPWHSRAADAIRGLRPAGTGARRGAPPPGAGAGAGRGGEGNGSTTFFIYVIGGYYPPNHHLVTGTDPLDSFEALWELAEMLGQVKPPTVTKEEIAQSGLEIVSPADLEACEKEGRVAASCIDRCLICLEDYVPEDEIRLMSCRHAFHKACVDQWLETGRNNCPACRSQGVATA
ncbi:hypothetical protein DENSPDRAFT_882348 [Dentipellis sp. KUC8613]|nr:hypothetical protein DENSPDRAFT_882348 [Dentipellis sp. KUC8613]